MFYFTDETIDSLIKEDVPYLDLTTTILGIGRKKGSIEYRFREDGIAACTEEAARVFEKLGLSVIHCIESGSHAARGATLLKATGRADALHMGWKVCLNILEYSSGIATGARKLVDKVHSVNPAIEVVFTRKSFPGTKELAVKAAIAGGMLPHRLGLSETVLIFKQHLCFLGNIAALCEKLTEIKRCAYEKKIIVEVENLEDAMALLKAGVDGIQFDKVPHETLSEYVKLIRAVREDTVLIAAGGIHAGNGDLYAKTGVDVIATSSVFHEKPLDIEARMSLE